MNSLNATLDQFDRLWRDGQRPMLCQFLEESELPDEQRPAALLEMIAIDMEYRWRSDAPVRSGPGDTAKNAAPSEETTLFLCGSRPLVEDYARQWPEILSGQPLPFGLVAEEYRIRHRWGDRPPIDQYFQRFGESAPLREALEAVRHELACDATAGESRNAFLVTGVQAAVSGETQPAEPVSLGRYRILKKLGEGGMGEVYLAEDTQLERRVALKTPHLGSGEHLQKRFVNEAKAAANLKHPGICPVYDAGEIDGQPFITMAFIEGETLRERWRRGESAAPLQALPILAQVAKAMHAAHETGIVHRDLKPSNVMIDAGGDSVVMDFGLAWRAAAAEDARVTRTGDTLGSPAYMSPEQVEGRWQDVGPTSDIYSLGVILFEALTGRLPFAGAVNRILIQIARDAPPRPSEIRPGVDPELEQFCLAMLAKSPADRPATMQAVAGRLEAIYRRLLQEAQAHSGHNMKSPPAGRSGWKWVAVACLPVLVLLGIVLFQIKTPYGTVRIEVAEEFADQVKVRVLQNGEAVEVADKAGGWRLRLEEGEYDFELGAGNERFKIEPKRVRVSRDRAQVVAVTISESPRPELPRPEPKSGLSPSLTFDAISWGLPRPLVELNTGGYEEGAWPSADGLRLYYEGALPAPEKGGILLAARPDAKSKFERIGKVAVGRHPTLSQDELVLVCLGGPENRQFCEARRARRDEPFPLPQPVAELSAVVNPKSPCMSRDGLQLVFQRNRPGTPISNDENEFAVTRRKSLNDPWQTPEPLAHFHASERGRPPVWPFLLDDGLTLLYGHGGDRESEVWWATRTSTDHPFETFQPVLVKGKPLVGRSPRFCADTQELFTSVSPIEGNWDLAVAVPQAAAPRAENYALFFDGVDDHVVTPIVYDGSHPITIEAWVAAADPWENGPIMDNMDGHGGISLQQYVESNNPNWLVTVRKTWSSKAVVDLFQRPKYTSKTHLAFVWDGDECRLYVDGQADRGYSKHSLQEIPGSERPFRLGVHWYQNRSPTEHWHRFHGLIDEIRISNVARYSANFRPAERFEPDDETLALYHCDEEAAALLKDSSGRDNHATITGAARKPAYEMHVPSQYYRDIADYERRIARDMPERTGPALRFETTQAHVTVPAVDLDFTRPFTLELWMTPQCAWTPTHHHMRLACRFGNFELKLDRGNEHWTFIGWDGRAIESMPWRRGTTIYDHRTHIAGQWNGTELKLYLNGRPCPGSMITYGSIANLREAILTNLAAANGQPIHLGSSGKDAQLGGTIDRFRLSKVARYEGPFEPDDLAADESTVVMYDFAEGEGDVLHDLSGNGYDGQISPGAIWEPAPRKIQPLPGLVAAPPDIDGATRWQVITRWPRAQPVEHGYSPDGKWYALGSAEGYVRIFSGGPQGNLHAVVHVRVQGKKKRLLMDWSSDSSRFVTASDGWVQVWSVEGALLREWQGNLTDVDWSPDGSLIAGTDRSGVFFWKPDGTLELTFPTYGDRVGSRFSWDATGQRYITSNGLVVLVGNLQGEVLRRFPVTSWARDLEWSPNGKRIAIVTADNRVQLWTPDGEVVGETKILHSYRTSPASWSPDSNSFALADFEHVMVWNSDGEQTLIFQSTQYKADGNNLCWSPDSRHVYIAKVDRSVAIHRTKDGNPVDVITAESPRITGVDWNSRRELLTASAHADRPLRLFDERGVPSGQFLDVKHTDSHDIKWGPDGEAVYVGGGSELYRFDVPQKQFVGPGMVLIRESSEYRVLATHPTRDLVAASGHPSNRVQILDTAGNVIATRQDLGGPVNELAFSPDGKWLAVCVAGRSLLLVETDTWEARTRLIAGCYGVGWSSDSSKLATNGDHGTVAVYDVQGQRLEIIEPVWNTGPRESALGSIAWSPDDRWVICSRNDETHAYQRETGERRNVVVNADRIQEATWINDDAFVTASEDGTLTCWNVETGEASWKTVYLHRDRQQIDSVTFSPQGAIRHADPGAADRLVYIVEREPDQLEVLSRAEFTRAYPTASPLVPRQ